MPTQRFDIELLDHTLLDEATATGTARARLIVPDPGLLPTQWRRKGAVDLGAVIVEGRVADYVATLGARANTAM